MYNFFKCCSFISLLRFGWLPLATHSCAYKVVAAIVPFRILPSSMFAAVCNLCVALFVSGSQLLPATFSHERHHVAGEGPTPCSGIYSWIVSENIILSGTKRDCFFARNAHLNNNVFVSSPYICCSSDYSCCLPLHVTCRSYSTSGVASAGLT